MPRLMPRVVVSLTCLALFAGGAQADSAPPVKKRLGFFESLFGQSHRQPPRRTLFGSNSASEKSTWWEEQQQRKNSGVDIIYGDPSSSGKKNRSVQPADYTEPEPLPGLGMGNVIYQPPLVTSVFDASFAKLTSPTPESENIRLALSTNAANIRTIDSDRKIILAFYKARGFKPIWTAAGHVSARAEMLLKTFANASAEGLVPQNYMPSMLTGFGKVDEALATDPQNVARFDIDLTVQALKYARHISGGQFDPNRLSLYNDIKPERASSEAALKVLAYSPYSDAYLASLAPTHPQYTLFKTELAKLSSATPGPAPDLVAEGATVKPGKTDPRLPLIRAKLQALGILSSDGAADGKDEMLDKSLSSGLKAFQKASKLKQTGALDSATVKAFNVDHSSDNRQRLVYNLERLRWLPKNLGNRYVLVNQAAFEVDVMDHGHSAWHSRVIVGRPLTQTYVFSDVMETIVFNPSWGVPASIIVNEYGPKSRKDAGYLDRNGFKVVNASGDVISSRSIDWFNMGHAPTFGVRQPAGNGNALGEVKFLFPNTHDIYMHDTPTKNLFTESMRAFSHGCVRVQNPRGFAEALLGWNQDKIAAVIETGESKSVNLKDKVPVHLTYFTAWTDAEGKIRYFDDIYGRDTALAKAFAYGKPGQNPQTTDKIVQNVDIVGGMSQN